MKKQTIAFALGAFLLAGCSQDETLMGTENEEAKLSFTVQTGAAVQTRANYGIGENIDQLLCAVYEKTGENTYTFVKQEEGTQQTSGATDFKYEPVLLKGHTYKVVFLALDKDAGYTANEGLTSITFPTTLTSNADNMDIFTGHSVDATVGVSDGNQTVRLSRPFGQLNFATTEQDITDVLALVNASSGATLTTSVEVTGQVAKAYDALNGTFTYGENSTTTTFAAAPLPEDTNTNYNWLSTNYLMTNALVTCTLHLYVNGTEANSLTVSNVPVKAKTRTNIYGRLLTGDVSYTVGCDNSFTDDNKKID